MANERLIFSSLTEFVRTLVGSYAIADVWADLAEQVAAAISLADAGVSVVDDLGICTYAEPKKYFSHRYATHKGTTAGRQLSVIGLGGL